MTAGVHANICSRNADADRAFFRDVLGFASGDAGNGRLIFAAPPCEVAFHTGESSGKQEHCLVCDDAQREIARLGKKGIAYSLVTDQGWGLATTIRLPGGGDLGLLQPRHARPHAPH